MAYVKAALALIVAVGVAYIAAVTFSTHSVLQRLVALGVEIPINVRIETTIQDWMGMAPLYLLIIAVGFFIAFVVAGLLSRFFPSQRTIVFTVAGFVAIVTAILIMNAALGVTGLAGARSTLGLLSQGLAGALGGYAFTRVKRIEA